MSVNRLHVSDSISDDGLMRWGQRLDRILHPVSFVNAKSSENCPVCLETMDKTHAVAHIKEGEKHPLHLKCILLWAEKNHRCPICRIPIDFFSLLELKTWHEKLIAILDTESLKALVGPALITIGCALLYELDVPTAALVFIACSLPFLAVRFFADELATRTGRRMVRHASNAFLNGQNE